MKIKTIKKVLRAKIDDWIASIEDESVRKLVKEHTLVTGGSIASMLLQEPVNDFDVYFTNKKTVLAVAQYYAGKFNQANPGLYDIKIVDEDSSNFDKGRVTIKVASSGVASTTEAEPSAEYADTAEDEAVKQALDKTAKEPAGGEEDTKPKYRPIFLSSNAITLSNRLQIVIRFYGNPEEVHENYDFVHAMNYWRSANSELVTHKEALEALLSRTLVYKGSLYPIASIFRAKKFLLRGWNINAGQYLKMAFQISKLDLTDLEVLSEQLVGCDMVYMINAVETLRAAKEKDPNLQFDATYFSAVIDRIFG